MNRELYMIALCVLAKFISGEKQDSVQVKELRGNALPTEVDVPIDELCCRMIHRYEHEPKPRLEKMA